MRQNVKTFENSRPKPDHYALLPLVNSISDDYNTSIGPGNSVNSDFQTLGSNNAIPLRESTTYYTQKRD